MERKVHLFFTRIMYMRYRYSKRHLFGQSALVIYFQPFSHGNGLSNVILQETQLLLLQDILHSIVKQGIFHCLQFAQLTKLLKVKSKKFIWQDLFFRWENVG